MKLLLVSLAIVAVAFCQYGPVCDSDDLVTSWATYREGRASTSPDRFFNDPLWEEYELWGWGMDGNNKWNDFWLRTLGGESHYSRVTCSTSSQGALPAYSSMCGDCSITASLEECLCYPYYDVAESYQESPKPTGGQSASETPEGWAGSYEIGNPPFETSTDSVDGPQNWSVDNCIQYKPKFVYYYTKRLRIRSDGQFQTSTGISKGFEPSQSAWEDFCADALSNSGDCPVPSDVGGGKVDSLFGARFAYDQGLWRANDDGDVQFFHREFESGCHAKTRRHRWPTANYCGDDSGWRFGAGTTAHVHYGCDVTTFFDTETDFDREIDDEDCGAVYLLFDEMNPLDVTVDHYDNWEWVEFSAMAQPLSNIDCWYESKWIDHRSEVPSYRTPCSASGLAVPLVALFATVLALVLNNF
uniref:Uncharacterized protein n=1 Tax=Paramoeba aestuarina TaxID=180227 RepID=A0A7S4L4Q3_9EUKA